MRLLGLVLLLVACSSGTEEGSGGSLETGGAAGEQAAERGGTNSQSAGAAARAGAATGGGAAEGGNAAVGGDGSAVAGAPPNPAGAGGESGEGSEAGTSGAPTNGGAGGSSGSASQAGTSTGGSSAGSGGSGSAPDPCEGIAHWSPTERWLDYEQGDQRVFGGRLWHCQSTAVCTAYPGHASSPGWFEDAECKGGPTNEVAPCQCAAGTCCDGCYLRPRSHFCGEFVRDTSCYGATVSSCGSATETLERDYWNLFCDGAEAATCTRWGAHTKFHPLQCPAGSGCADQGDQASCVTCN